MQHFHLITLFPDFFESPLKSSILGRAIANELIDVRCVDIRSFTNNKHNRVDDIPYGGGGGMVIQAEPVVLAIESVQEHSPDVHVVHLSPKGRPFTQAVAFELAAQKNLAFVCGHYEGIDGRADAYMDDSISLGDFVITGGEIAALCLMDSISRLQEGVLGNPLSNQIESHTGDGLLEHPHYTRPRVFRDVEVPAVLLNGNHAKIDKWRRKASLEETFLHRPDILRNMTLSSTDTDLLKEIHKETSEKTGKKT